MFPTPGFGYRPLQLYHFLDDGIRCATAAPSAALADRVNYYWLLNIEQPSFDLEVIPDNAMDLVVSPLLGDFAALYFPRDKPFRISPQGPVVYAGVSLKAEQATAIFGTDIARLKSLEPGLETASALGLGSTIASIRGANDLDAIAGALEDVVARRPDGNAMPPLTGAMDQLLTRLEPGGVASVAKTLGISERKFRRLSSELLGLGPKKIQRVLRLQHLLTEFFTASKPLSCSGYYDDAHLIHELSTLTRLTPGKIRRMAENYNPD